MEGLMMFGGLVIAAVAQKLNASPRWNVYAVKLSLAGLGLVLYLLVDQPAGWPGSAEFLRWFGEAWKWGLALPGAASLIALAPGLATKNAN